MRRTIFGRWWIWLLRFRKRKGYGVHSPFAFSFITNVIYEKGAYYAYRELDKRYAARFPLSGRKYYSRCHRLLFRLANYVQPSEIVCLGKAEVEAAYMHAAVGSLPSSLNPQPSTLDYRLSTFGPPSLVFSKASHLAEAVELLPSLSEKSMMVLEGIHHNAANKTLWQQVQNHPNTGITFDLFTYGIVLFDTSRHKQHYKVNF